LAGNSSSNRNPISLPRNNNSRSSRAPMPCAATKPDTSADLAQLHLPPGMYRAIQLTDDRTPVTYLACPDGSWCEITRTPNTGPRWTLPTPSE